MPVDGTATGAGGSCVLTTTNSGDLIVVMVGGGNTGTAGAGITLSGGGLSWTQKAFANDGSTREVQLWSAVAASPLSSVTITATGSAWAFTGISAWGISGANTTTPVDPNVSSIVSAHGTSATPTVTGVSTSNANDMLVAGMVCNGSGPPSAASGFTLVWGTSGGPVVAGEYEIVSATQSGISVTFPVSGAASWAMLVAAIQMAGGGGAQPETNTHFVGRHTVPVLAGSVARRALGFNQAPNDPGPPPPPYTGLGDVYGPAIGYWGLRALNAAAAGGGLKALQLQRASDNALLDIALLPNGSIDLAAATSFLSGTTGGVSIWYDQSGNGYHMAQATQVLQPQFGFNLTSGGAPAVVFTSVTLAAAFTNGSASIGAANAFVAGQIVRFQGGTLPTGFTANTPYFVLSAGLSGAAFEVSATMGGTAITAGSAGSGSHTVISGQFLEYAAGIPALNAPVTFGSFAQPQMTTTRNVNYVYLDSVSGGWQGWQVDGFGTNNFACFFAGSGAVANSNNAWHAAQLIANQGSSSVNLDGTTTGLSLGIDPQVSGPNSIGCDISGASGPYQEFFNGYLTETSIFALNASAPQMAAAYANQNAFWNQGMPFGPALFETNRDLGRRLFRLRQPAWR